MNDSEFSRAPLSTKNGQAKNIFIDISRDNASNHNIELSTISPKININGDLFQVFPTSPVSNKIKQI